MTDKNIKELTNEMLEKTIIYMKGYLAGCQDTFNASSDYDEKIGLHIHKEIIKFYQEKFDESQKELKYREHFKPVTKEQYKKIMYEAGYTGGGALPASQVGKPLNTCDDKN